MLLSVKLQIMDSQSSYISRASTTSAVADDCTLNLSDSQDGEVILRRLVDFEQEYFAAWNIEQPAVYDQTEEGCC